MNQRTEIIQNGVRWYDEERTILLCRSPEEWTWSTVHKAFHLMNVMSGEMRHPIYRIVCFPMAESASLPQGRAIPNLRRLMNAIPLRSQLTFFVGTNSLFHQLLHMTAQLYRLDNQLARCRLVDSVDEALILIDRHKRSVAEADHSLIQSLY